MNSLAAIHVCSLVTVVRARASGEPWTLVPLKLLKSRRSSCLNIKTTNNNRGGGPESSGRAGPRAGEPGMSNGSLELLKVLHQNKQQLETTTATPAHPRTSASQPLATTSWCLTLSPAAPRVHHGPDAERRRRLGWEGRRSDGPLLVALGESGAQASYPGRAQRPEPATLQGPGGSRAVHWQSLGLQFHH